MSLDRSDEEVVAREAAFRRNWARACVAATLYVVVAGALVPEIPWPDAPIVKAVLGLLGQAMLWLVFILPPLLFLVLIAAVSRFQWRWSLWALLQLAVVLASAWVGFHRDRELDGCDEAGRPCRWFEPRDSAGTNPVREEAPHFGTGWTEVRGGSNG